MEVVEDDRVGAASLLEFPNSNESGDNVLELPLRSEPKMGGKLCNDGKSTLLVLTESLNG